MIIIRSNKMQTDLLNCNSFNGAKVLFFSLPVYAVLFITEWQVDLVLHLGVLKLNIQVILKD